MFLCIGLSKNGIVDMVWSVGLNLKGDEFELGLEQKGKN